MNELINWVARNNTLMIQSGFTIVLLLIVIYIYRLFFVNGGSSRPVADGNVNQLSEKIDQLLQQRIANSAGTVGGGAGATSSNDVGQLQAEVNSLRTALNESEKKVFELSPSSTQSADLETNNLNEEKVAELTAKIEHLEARLSEYEIIADDIAELSQLRAENSELKSKLSLSGDEVATAVKITSEQILDEVMVSGASQSTEENIYVAAASAADDNLNLIETESLPEINLDPIVASDEASTTDEATSLEVVPDFSLDSDPIQAEAGEKNFELDPIILGEESVSTSEVVDENDKNILDDFEKVSKRGST
ncbi:MAG: hypothetical protein H7061_14320 [Bdellovibrionaceae bacterium]|nr:hypothetical protein [Bdellovibrio sp.]